MSRQAAHRKPSTRIRAIAPIAILAALCALFASIAIWQSAASSNVSDYQPIPSTATIAAAPDDDYSIQLEFLSDIHLSGSDDEYSAHLETALDDIDEQAHDSSVLCIAGDGIDSAKQVQYDQLKSILTHHGYTTPSSNLFVAIGNHECWGGQDETYAALRAAYMQNWGYDNVYHNMKVDDKIDLIALGSDQSPAWWTHASFSSTELAWLERTLAADEQSGLLSIVVCHHPVAGTVNGSEAGQYGSESGIDNSADLLAVLQKHDNVVFVSGHTHLDLTDEGAIFRAADGTGPLYVRDGAVAYLREATGEGGASQGLYMTITSQTITIAARDFTDSVWLWKRVFFR